MSCFRPYTNEPLPDQDEYCREPGAMCGYVEKSLSRSKWDKRLAIISAQGELIIYKEPLMGKIYELKKMKNMRLERLANGRIVVQIYLNDGKKVKLRLSGENAAAWAAKLINIKGESLGHQTHPNIDYTSLQSRVPLRSETVKSQSPQEKILGIHRASPSISNNSKFSYSVTLQEGEESSEDYGISRNGGEDVLLSGDFPSIIDCAKFDGMGRARGGKVQEDVSEMIHTIMTTSSHTSSNRKLIRQQVDELIKKHMQENGKRRENDYHPETICPPLNSNNVSASNRIQNCM
ncbi:unnamed protein product [Cylicocyclus nassatus]|uniref:PH-15 domain-containing protein n=1 Tax=Cylicocyclus nassatus TaxID=53992 RepID=A0AA36GVH3_CYLNA|nr:unnamed protein product [Cylicocyclus nassatus]